MTAEFEEAKLAAINANAKVEANYALHAAIDAAKKQ